MNDELDEIKKKFNQLINWDIQNIIDQHAFVRDDNKSLHENMKALDKLIEQIHSKSEEISSLKNVGEELITKLMGYITLIQEKVNGKIKDKNRFVDHFNSIIDQRMNLEDELCEQEMRINPGKETPIAKCSDHKRDFERKKIGKEDLIEPLEENETLKKHITGNYFCIGILIFVWLFSLFLAGSNYSEQPIYENKVYDHFAYIEYEPIIRDIKKCAVYNKKGKCLQCKKGFSLSETNECIRNKCFKDCKLCQDNKCVVCEKGYQLFEGKCQKIECGEGCELCDNDNKCSKCKEGFSLKDGQCSSIHTSFWGRLMYVIILYIVCSIITLVVCIVIKNNEVSLLVFVCVVSVSMTLLYLTGSNYSQSNYSEQPNYQNNVYDYFSNIEYEPIIRDIKKCIVYNKEGKCLQCKEGFSLSETNKCIRNQCSKDCKLCQENKCIVCEKGYQLFEGNCHKIECDEEYDKNMKDKEEISKLKEEQDKQLKDKENEINKLKEDNDKNMKLKEEQVCGKGYQLFEGNCQKIECGEECELCDSDNKCSKCKEGFSLNDGQCSSIYTSFGGRIFYFIIMYIVSSIISVVYNVERWFGPNGELARFASDPSVYISNIWTHFSIDCAIIPLVVESIIYNIFFLLDWKMMMIFVLIFAVTGLSTLFILFVRRRHNLLDTFLDDLRETLFPSALIASGIMTLLYLIGTLSYIEKVLN